MSKHCVTAATLFTAASLQTIPLHQVLTALLCASSFQTNAFLWCVRVCVCVFSYLKLCRRRCATHTPQCEPKWGNLPKLVKWTNCMLLFAKYGAHYIIGSFSLMNSGEAITFRGAYALKNASVSQQLGCPSKAVIHPAIHSSSQPHILPFLQSSILQSRIIRPLSPPTAPKQQTASLCKSHNKIRKPITHTLPVTFIQKTTHKTHKYAKWKQRCCSGVETNVVTFAKNGG